MCTRICLVSWERAERPQQPVCYRAGHEIGGLELEERKESDSLPVSLVSVACGHPGNAWKSRGLRQRDGVAKKKRLYEKICVITGKRGQ